MSMCVRFCWSNIIYKCWPNVYLFADQCNDCLLYEILDKFGITKSRHYLGFGTKWGEIVFIHRHVKIHFLITRTNKPSIIISKKRQPATFGRQSIRRTCRGLGNYFSHWWNIIVHTPQHFALTHPRPLFAASNQQPIAKAIFAQKPKCIRPLLLFLGPKTSSLSTTKVIR